MLDDSNIIHVEQGSSEWLSLRCGSVGGSSVADALARTKSGWGASRKNLAAQLIVERLTGVPTETFKTAAMLRGNEIEPEARDNYELEMNVDVEQVGLVLHPHIKGAHTSPDGLIGLDGCLEIKAPNTANHIDTLIADAVPTKYIYQCQWHMTCTGRKWCDFVSYDDRVPPEMQLFIKRVERDDDLIDQLQLGIQEFVDELDEQERILRGRFGLAEE